MDKFRTEPGERPSALESILQGTYNTEVGEMRTVMLEDGSRVSLNTSTSVRVKLTAARRSIEVEKGEALFEVAKDAHRPFVVRVVGSEVVALGTVFSVRLRGRQAGGEEALAVSLIEGKVAVQPAGSDQVTGSAPAKPILMAAGERLRPINPPDAKNSARIQVDRPRTDQVVAWTRSEAVFDDVPLQGALDEMNRYSRIPVVWVGTDESLSRLRISGLYRTGDSLGFARAVATLHGLSLREREDRLELTSN